MSTLGAKNALRAYVVSTIKGYSDRTVRILAFMGLKSIDADEHPWFRMGHETIAVKALGREPAGEDEKAREANAKAVQRGPKDPLKDGVVSHKRKGESGGAATYLLHFDPGAPDAKHPMDTVEEPRPR